MFMRINAIYLSFQIERRCRRSQTQSRYIFFGLILKFFYPFRRPLFGFDDAPSAKWLEPALSSVYLPIDNMIVTAIDQAIRLARNQPVDAIPPFTGTLVLRDSVTTGPYFHQMSSKASSS